MEVSMKLLGIAEDQELVATEIITQKIIDDDDFLKKVLVKAVLEKNKEDIGISNLHFNLISQGTNKFASYYNFGNNHYVDYLPEAQIHTDVLVTSTFKNLIDDLFSIDSTIIDIKLGTPTNQFLVWQYLQDNYGYSIKNNVMMFTKQWSINYMARLVNYSIIERVDDSSIIYLWFRLTLNEVSINTTLVTENTKITITNIDATTDNKNTLITRRTLVSNSRTGTISDNTVVISDTNTNIPIGSESDSNITTTISETSEYVYISTRIEDIPIPVTESRQYSIMYYSGDDKLDVKLFTFDAEDNPYDLSDEVISITNIQMLPIVCLRNARVNVNKEIDEERYNSTKKILSSINLSLDTFIEEIEKNPDIDKVEDVFIHFAISPSSTNPIVSKVLFKFFYEVLTDDRFEVSPLNDSTNFSLIVKEDPMNITLAWTYTAPYETEKVIGDIGTYTHYIEPYDTQKKVYDYNYDGYPFTSYKTEKGYNLIIEHQITETTCTRIELKNIVCFTLIDRGSKYAVYSPNPNNENFLIPLNYGLVRSLSTSEEIEIFAESLRITFYALDVQHIEWYQTGQFAGFLKFVLLAITLVVTITSFGTMTAKGVTVTAALLSILKTFAIGIGISLALKYVHEQTSNIFLIALLTAAITYFAYVTGNFEALSTTLTALTLAMIPINSFNMLYEYKSKELKEERLDFLESAENRLTELEDVMETLNNQLLNATDIVSLNSIESPYINSIDAYYYAAKSNMYNNYDLLYNQNDNLYNYDNFYKLGIV